MKKAILTLLGALILACTFAQEEFRQLIDEGIALHDQGNFDDAIRKYDAALAIRPNDHKALYEKAYSLVELKKYSDAKDLLQKIIKDKAGNAFGREAYVLLGTILDYEGQPKKALKKYDEGIREFPDYYMLHFNKGITLMSMKNQDEAVNCFQQSARLNPFHGSSWNALSIATGSEKRLASMLDVFMFLLVEPDSKRSPGNLQRFNQLFYRGISKGENGVINVSIPMNFDKNPKKVADDDFGIAEFTISLLASNTTIEDSLGLKTDGDRLNYKMKLVVGAVAERVQVTNDGTGFYKGWLVPFYTELKASGHIETACRLVLTSKHEPENDEWLTSHKIEVDALKEWMRSFFQRE